MTRTRSGCFRLDLLRHAPCSGVVWIDAEEKRHVRILDTGEIAFNHLPEHILLVPIRDENRSPGNRAGLLVQPRIPKARDAHREEIDEGIVERRYGDEHTDQKQHNDQQVTHDRLVGLRSFRRPNHVPRVLIWPLSAIERA